MDFETRAIHAGQEPDPPTGAVIDADLPDLHVRAGGGRRATRATTTRASPTRRARRSRSASRRSRAPRTGSRSPRASAPTTTIMHLLDPGDRVVCVNDVYGGTYRHVLPGLRAEGLPLHLRRRRTSVRRARRRTSTNARIVWVESPTNPLLNVVDIARGRRRGACRRRARSSSTTRSPRRTSSSRSSSAPTSSCTRRRSTSAATPTSSAASPPRTTRRSRSGCASCRSRSAPSPARSTPGSCCAG